MKRIEESRSRFIKIVKEFVGINLDTENWSHNLLEEGYVDSIEFLNLLMALEEEFEVVLDLTNFEGPNPDNINTIFKASFNPRERGRIHTY